MFSYNAVKTLIMKQHLLLGKQLEINHCRVYVVLPSNTKEQSVFICLPPEYVQPAGLQPAP